MIDELKSLYTEHGLAGVAREIARQIADETEPGEWLKPGHVYAARYGVGRCVISTVFDVLCMQGAVAQRPTRPEGLRGRSRYMRTERAFIPERKYSRAAYNTQRLEQEVAALAHTLAREFELHEKVVSSGRVSRLTGIPFEQTYEAYQLLVKQGFFVLSPSGEYYRTDKEYKNEFENVSGNQD